jgi:hypothetical protein
VQLEYNFGITEELPDDDDDDMMMMMMMMH